MSARLACLAVGLLLAQGAVAEFWDTRALAIDPATATAPLAPALEGLGTLHHEVSTRSPDSQQFFDQGLRLAYAFNHSEALRAFKEAARLDPGNAMAYWGWAWVLGPNLNLPMVPEVAAQAWAATQKAMSLRATATPAERAYIEALAKRYADPAPADRSALDRAFADAMRDVAGRFPEDPDAATIYAEALMDISPWNYWRADGSGGEYAQLIVDTLETVLRRHPDHMGALHLHIHALEAVDGRRAEVSADRLLTLAPAAGHLVHMPSHIYMRVGRYTDAARTNELADAADNRYVAQCNAQGIYPLFYHRHNQHFLTWAAMFQGRSQAALDAGRHIGHGLEPEMLAGPLSETLQHLLIQPVYVLVRFGRWDDILREPPPNPQYDFATAIWHYARGMAYAGTRRLRPARRELAGVRQAAASQSMQDKFVGFAPAPAVLGIAGDVLDASIASAMGEHDLAVTRLDRAVRIQDGFRYNEPPDWYFPVRHYLGAALLDAGRAAEAETVYWQDLERNPDNGYAWLGLQQALAAQGKAEQAAWAAARQARAWRDADVKLSSSRF